MDGVDFMPTNRNILFGYHFKSIAAAGPIVGAIVAATLWGWLPAMIWLIVGVAFMGWVSDYSAIVLSVRNEGHSLSAVAHRLISPRTRTILFLFIFFYLLLVAGAFVGIMATVMETQPRTYMGMILLVIMGLLLGQMLYRWRVGLVPATMITVGITLVAIMTGHASEPIFKGLNDGLNSLTGGAPLVTYFDPTLAGFKGAEAKIMPTLLFWALAISIFCYAGSVLPIWRMAQPVVYVGFWITALAMVLGLSGSGAFMIWLGRGWDRPLESSDELYKYGRPANATVEKVENEELRPEGVRTAATPDPEPGTTPTCFRSAQVRCSPSFCLECWPCWRFR